MAALSTDPPPRRRAPATAEDEASTPRRGTGSNAELPTRHADNDKVNEAAGFQRPEPASRPKVRSKPRPSRARLDKAEKALELSEREFRGTIAHIREQEKALQQKRRDLEKRHESEVAKLEAAIAKARESYGDALQKWRD